MSNAVIFAYRGRDAAGKVIKGKLEAGSKAAVVSRLRTMGLAPIEIQESAAGTGLQTDISLGFLDKGVGLKDLAIMARQMATMVGSGLSLLRTLTILVRTDREQEAQVFAHPGAQASSSRARPSPTPSQGSRRCSPG